MHLATFSFHSHFLTIAPATLPEKTRCLDAPARVHAIQPTGLRGAWEGTRAPRIKQRFDLTMLPKRGQMTFFEILREIDKIKIIFFWPVGIFIF
jgi:hypothetical protein